MPKSSPAVLIPARLALASGRAVLGHTAEEHLAAAQDGIAKTDYKRRLAEVDDLLRNIPTVQV